MDIANMMGRLRYTKERCPIHDVPLIYMAGLEVNGKSLEPFCPECNREKVNQQEEQDTTERVAKKRKERTYGMLKRSSIVGNDKMFSKTFDNFDVTCNETQKVKMQAMRIAESYLAREEFNCILTGQPGTGKSHLAMAILQEVNEHAEPYMSCLFVSLIDLLAEIRDSFNSSTEGITEAQAKRLLKSADLLVIDDLGSESSFGSENNQASDFVQRVLFQILNARSRTIITTNLSGQELKQVYNPKIISRLLENSESEHFINMTGIKDNRRKF
ncbi:ATP-binding protein [Enterococcus cecorum]|uniref:ATP-binding protein n=1 Tax=Enterococcus cecorum TaxID=44008 RepID=UPI000A557D81|nr:ATP-binding protein [Enterococcus cecorum]CAI3349436.1 ATP-binding protein [Enterococcus cecorum]